MSPSPTLFVVPVETDWPRQGRSGTGNGDKKANEDKQGKERDKQDGDEKRSQKEPSDSKGNGGDDQESGSHQDKNRGQSAKGPSLMRILLYSGAVALACGVAGSWAYSYFSGSSKSDQNKSSGKDSNSGKSSGSAKDSGSDKSSDASKNNAEEHKLVQAEAAWMAAVKELHDAQSAEKTARRSEQDAKSVVNFLKQTLLSAGRPGDVSLAEAFWAGGQGKDLSLRKALDMSETQVTDAFADRPLAEATVREMLGLAYLNLGDSAQAVKEYERALSLREAMQGANDPETASCRNQLAVAYRLAGRASEGGRLFERNPNSTAHASALAIRGSVLLLQKQPADAELKLREALTIRQKTQPEDWTTFDTKSMLGEALLDQNKFSDAEPLLLSGYEGMKQHENAIPAPDKPHLIKAARRLVRLYEAWGQKDKAMRWRSELEGQEAGIKY